MHKTQLSKNDLKTQRTGFTIQVHEAQGGHKCGTFTKGEDSRTGRETGYSEQINIWTEKISKYIEDEET